MFRIAKPGMQYSSEQITDGKYLQHQNNQQSSGDVQLKQVYNPISDLQECSHSVIIELIRSLRVCFSHIQVLRNLVLEQVRSLCQRI